MGNYLIEMQHSFKSLKLKHLLNRLSKIID